MSTAQPAPLSFRDAGEADVAELVALVESAYRGETSRGGWTTEADYLEGQRTDEDGVRQIVNAPEGTLLVVERADEMVACCHLEHRGDHAYFGMFAVRPGLQGGGGRRGPPRRGARGRGPRPPADPAPGPHPPPR
ncbi:hypothetical protein ACFXB3_30705, partial [Streptomyces sp. NPDC059447]